MHDVMRGRWSALRVVLALALALTAVAAVTHAHRAEAQEAAAAPVWSPGGQCFRSREPTPQEVADYGVPAGTVGAHSRVLWAGPGDSGYYYAGCVPPGYEWNGTWWEQGDSPYRMVDCTDDLGNGCFWYATTAPDGGSFVWARKAFVGFTGPGGGGNGGGGGGPSPQPGPDGSVDCGDGVVLLATDIDNAITTLRGTGNFTEAGLSGMRADPCRYFPTSCLNLGHYMDQLTPAARSSFRERLSGPDGHWALADRILDDPCSFVTGEWMVAGAISIPGLGNPAVPLPIELFPPLPFTIPGQGNPAERCRIMADATSDDPVVPAAAVATAGKSAGATLMASTGAEPNPHARWYEGAQTFALQGTQALVAVNLNGLASPVMGSGEFFDSVVFNSHLTVRVIAGYDPETCQEVAGPRIERISIREVYEVVGTDMSRFREVVRNSQCTGTSLCRRDWRQVAFTDSAAIGGGITSSRHFAFVTVKVEGRAPVELPAVASRRLAFF
jgi:hypothetical protein